MTEPDYRIIERRSLRERVRVLAVLDADDTELAAAYGHFNMWHVDIAAAALNAAGMDPTTLLHGFWVASEGEARTWLAFLARVGRPAA